MPINGLFPCRVLKEIKDYTIFPIVWVDEVRWSPAVAKR